MKLTLCEATLLLVKMQPTWNEHYLLGYLPLGKEDVILIFQLINMRYKKHSTIITSNVMLGQWDAIFDGSMIDAAILDRLVEKSHIISMNSRR